MSNFLKIFERVKTATSIKNMVQLSEIVEASQQNVSWRKKEDSFPVEWAYKIAKKYELNIEWILEGTGPQRPGQINEDPEIIKQIVSWIQELEKKEPGALAWFTYDFKKKYPDFDRWEKREEGNSDKHTAGIKNNTA